VCVCVCVCVVVVVVVVVVASAFVGAAPGGAFWHQSIVYYSG
jgi:hypothetical protein